METFVLNLRGIDPYYDRPEDEKEREREGSRSLRDQVNERNDRKGVDNWENEGGSTGGNEPGFDMYDR